MILNPLKMSSWIIEHLKALFFVREEKLALFIQKERILIVVEEGS